MDSILTDSITLQSFLICLAVAMILGVLTALVFSYKSEHTASFSLTLALIPMIVALIIMMVNGNIGTGVAVAGAFALVRFRSVPGTAREIAAIFTAMAIGLAIGMGYIGISVLFFLFVAVFALLLTKLNFGGKEKRKKSLKIMIPEDTDYDGLFDDVFDKYQVDARLEKIRTTDKGKNFELTYQAIFPQAGVSRAFLNEIQERNGNLGITVGSVADRETL